MESKEYKELKNEIEDLKRCVKSQEETLKKILNAIVGDKEFGQEGIVEMVRKHDKWIQSQKVMWAKIWGGIAVGTTLGTFLIKFWDKIF